MKVDGARMRAARINAGKSTQDAAQIAEMSDSSISRMETKGGTMNLHIARALAKAYGVAVRSFEAREVVK